MKFYIRLLQILIILFVMDVGNGVNAQETQESDTADAGESDEDFSSDMAEIFQDPLPENSSDYQEIHQMRVLERVLLPSESYERGGAVLEAANPMLLSHDAAMIALGDGAGEVLERGLQRQSTRLMREAVARVREQVATAGASLVEPFGLACSREPVVEEYVAIFTRGAASTIKTWLKRLGRWKAVLEPVLQAEGVPVDLIYLAMIESGFKTRVKSPASAAGMWQFMAGTAAEMGLTIDAYVDERFDPVKSARAAARYLKKQYARYGSWPLAMAAYNGGPGTVNVAIDRYNTTDYFKLVQYGAMYDETRRYVPRIMAAAVIGKNLESFGFSGLASEAPFVFDTVDVPPLTRLEVLAQAAGCGVDELRELNPELLKNETPPGREYSLRIPLDHYRRFVENFDRISKRYASTEPYFVRFGETPETFAQDTGVPARVLRALNGLGAKENPAYGSEILVPLHTARKTPKDIASDFEIVALVSPEVFTYPARERIFYQTQPGDRLSEIALAFGVLDTELAVWNDLDLWGKLRPRQVLQVFVPKQMKFDNIRTFSESDIQVITKGSEAHREWLGAKASARLKTARAHAGKKASGGRYATHTVLKGDSLSKIAKKYGVTVDSLLKLNGLKKNATIKKGQVLKVRSR